MKFGFVAHPTSVPLKRHVKLVDTLDRTTKDLEDGYSREHWTWRNLVPFVEVTGITSATGARCDGIVHYLPLTAADMMAKTGDSLRRIIAGVRSLHEQGAEIVGLGGFTAILGQRGEVTARESAVPVTTGNSLTAYAACEALEYVFESLEVDPREAQVAVIGYPGSIAIAVARLLVRRGCRVTLVHRAQEENPPWMINHIDAELRDRCVLTNQLEAAIESHLFFASASSSGDLIDPRRLRPGSVVVDIALPRDVLELGLDRTDILIVDGGYLSASSAVKFGGDGDAMSLAMRNQINGCLAETLILALDGRAESFSLGQTLPVEGVLAIGEAARRHGFSPLPLASWGERISSDRLIALRRHHRRTGAEAAAKSVTADQVRAEAIDRFNRFMDPIAAEYERFHHLGRVFARAEGSTLIECGGREYLDMAAGHGALILGHNHPAVVARVHEALSASRPALAQHVSVPPEAALLAERLCELAPGRMGRVTFVNSAIEAMDTGLTLARLATGRARVLVANDSSHVKAIADRSMSGRSTPGTRLRPLPPDVTSIPFGDLDALRRELGRGDVAAFLVEPVQCDAGVVTPPEGYLAAARDACKSAGALLAVDETRTGFGRTGRMFACQWDGVDPDVLLLGEALSGGVLPIGATLTRADLWDTAHRCSWGASHAVTTSGGGALAALAGLAVLDAFAQGDLPGRALELGGYLAEELLAIAKAYPFLREVRGRGLLLGVRVNSTFDQGFAALTTEIGTRLPGNWHQVYRLLPTETRDHFFTGARQAEAALEDLLCMRFVTKLAQDHGILTEMSLLPSRVLRIHPPLLLTRPEAERFVAAFKAVCADMATFAD